MAKNQLPFQECHIDIIISVFFFLLFFVLFEKLGNIWLPPLQVKDISILIWNLGQILTHCTSTVHIVVITVWFAVPSQGSMSNLTKVYVYEKHSPTGMWKNLRIVPRRNSQLRKCINVILLVCTATHLKLMCSETD